MNDTLLIDYGCYSHKLTNKSWEFKKYYQLLNSPKNSIDLSNKCEKENNNLYYKSSDVENEDDLKTISSYLDIKKKESFIVSLDLDFEFQKKSYLEKLFSEMFDINNFEKGQVILKPLCVYIAMELKEKKNILIVDSGEDSTYIIPICEGYIMMDSIERSILGGKHVTENLKSFLEKKNPEVFMHIKKKDLIKIKEENLKICPNYEKYQYTILPKYRCTSKRIKLPDQNIIKFDQEVFELTESLFSPKKFGLDGRGLGEKVFNSIKVILKRNVLLI